MDMMIPGMVQSTQSAVMNQVQSSKSGQSAGAEGGFQQTLVQQIVSETTNSGEQTQSNGPVAIVSQIAAATIGESSPSGLTAEEVMSLIDSLVDQLDDYAETDEPGTKEQLEELQALLDEMNALLALLGIPVPHLQKVKPNQTMDNAVGDVQMAMSHVKTGLQDSLLQLQTMMQQGALKQVQGQEPLLLIGRQIEAMAAALQQDDAKNQESKGSKIDSASPAWLNLSSSAAKDNSSLLQRLTHQAVHPSVFNAALANVNEQSATQPDVLLSSNSEGAITGQMPFVTTDNVREFAPLLTKSAAPTAFVLAEEFAETMNGLIVQKFDIRTVNGLTEAKLMLFPEQMGQVDVRISMQNGLLTAVFQTDTATAKDMLENQMAQLRASLQAQGLNVDKLEVTQSQSASDLSGQHAGQGNKGQQPFDNRQSLRDEENVKDAAFESEMIEHAAIQGLGYGRAINETA